jgi:hypothetical protein
MSSGINLRFYLSCIVNKVIKHAIGVILIKKPLLMLLSLCRLDLSERSM